MSRLVVVDYDPNWPRLFESMRSTIWPAVADIAMSIEHVGSTAVLGLAAKPVIDIDVVVADDQVAAGIARLATLGYEHQGDCGVPQREAFRAPLGRPAHHLYLCPASSPGLANHLAIRDHLRANPGEAREYGELKKRLAIAFADDVDGYVEAKSDCLLAMLRRIGFAADTLADIARINRRPQRAG